MKVLPVIGTHPEAIGMAPVAADLVVRAIGGARSVRAWPERTRRHLRDPAVRRATLVFEFLREVI